MTIEDQFIAYAKDNKRLCGSLSGTDYATTYDTIVGIFTKDILPEINSKMAEYEDGGYYNDHGIKHVKMVIDRITKIINVFNSNKSVNSDGRTKENNNEFLQPFEIFVLLLSTYLHDAGHLIVDRAKHASAAHELLSRFCVRDLHISEKRVIGDIARAHVGEDDPISILTENPISDFEIRTKLLASILRLADELAEDKTRASEGLLHLEDQEKDPPNTHIKEFSEIYHRFSQCTDSVIIEGKEIKLFFCINKKQLARKFRKENPKTKLITEHFLLDEIYERTYKTFTETLYCNRFFPAQSRFEIIKVNIDILEEYGNNFKTISYELKESGYPVACDINELIYSKLMENGQVINGEYIANLITSKT